MTKPKYGSPEERRKARAANLARNVRALTKEQRSSRSKKSNATRRKRELYLSGDRENSLGERFDLAFDAFDPATGILPPTVLERILDKARAQDVTLVLRVAVLDTNTDERSDIERLRVDLPQGLDNEKDARGLIYAALRNYVTTAGPDGGSDPDSALLLRGISFATDY